VRGDERGQHVALALLVRLEIDDEAAVGHRGQHLAQLRHHADTLAAQREGFAAIGGVAVAEVERAQIGHVVVAGAARPIGAAVERPVVDHGEEAVGGRMHVQLDDVGAGGKRGLHGRQRVLDEIMPGRVDALGGAGLVVEVLAMVCLVDAAMSDQPRGALGRRRQQRRVQKPDGGDGHGEAEQNLSDHTIPSGRVGRQAAWWN